jgi:hypothetical protein
MTSSWDLYLFIQYQEVQGTRSSHRYTIMNESPYMGWVVPHPWQEPEYEEDQLDQTPEDDSDYDDEGKFTLR